ncbi:MAG: carboxypeptidase regulatory-like domain-containing protein [bacterium]|nr:carboxypeptidase regulatory-like domain-containing protein [bacterium]
MNRIIRAASLHAAMLLLLTAGASAQLTVSGTVLEEPAGRGLAGAELELRLLAPRLQESAEQATNRVAVSDSEGRYLLRVPQIGVFEVIAHARDRATMLYRPLAVVTDTELTPVVLGNGSERTTHDEPFGAWSPAGEADDGLTSDAEAGRIMVEGRIVDSVSRRPIARSLVWSGADPGAFVLSDSEGRYRMALPTSKDLWIRAESAGYLPRAVEVPNELPASEQAHIDMGTLILTPESVPRPAISGLVVDAEGQPIADAEIAVRRPDPEGRETERPWLTASDEDGRFELSERPTGILTIEVFAREFAPAEPLELGPGEAADDLYFVLERGASLEGRVTTLGGEPVAGVRITVGRPATHSDAEGAYRIEGLPPGRATVDAFHPDYEPQAERIEIQQGVNLLDWSFEDGTWVSGLVVDEAGTPVAEAHVELRLEPGGEPRTYSGRSADDGSFELSPVAIGSYRLAAAKEGYADAMLPTAVIVVDEAVEDLQIVLRPGASIFGRIAGLRPDELARLRVEATDGRSRARSGQTDGDLYEIVDLAPGDWLIEASLPDGRRHTQARVSLQPRVREARRDLRFGGVTLSGVVLLDGEPAPETSVSLQGSEEPLHRTVVTGFEGEFRFEDLGIGSYALALTNPEKGFVSNRTFDLPGDRHLALDFRTSRISGQVVATSGYQGVTDALVYLRKADASGLLVTAGTDATGGFELERLQPGRYLLGARKDGYAPAEVELEVTPGSDLAGLELALSESSIAE